MTFPTKLHLSKLNLTSQKDLLLLKKRYSKVSSLQIPMKGSSSLSDYSIETALKASKPSSHMFKMLRKMKVDHISDGLLKFFAKNKQVLKGVRSLSAGIGSLPSDKTLQFSRLMNCMKYLQKIDDLAKFSVREVMKQRGFSFKPPHKLTSKPLAGRKAVVKGGHALCLKKVHPLRHVQEIQFSPHLNVKRLFPYIKQVAIEMTFLDKLSEFTKAKPTTLIVTDKKTFALASEPNWEALNKAKTLENITLNLTDSENTDLSKIISNLPKKDLNLSMNFDLDILISNEENLSKLGEFITETNSKVHFNVENWPNSQDFSKVIQATYNGRFQELVTFSKFVLDAEYSLELQRQVWDSFVHSKNLFDDVLIKVNVDDAAHQMIGPYVQTAHSLEGMSVLNSEEKRSRDKIKKSKFIVMHEEEKNSKASSE